MRAHTTGRRVALAALATVLLVGPAAPVALADPADPVDPAPSRGEVEAAREAVGDKARDVAAVQTDLVLAEQRRQASTIRVAQAMEAWNGARWELAQARRDARRADARSTRAERTLGTHEAAFGEVLAAAYEMSPEIATMAAIAGEDGIDGVIEQANTMYHMTASMDEVQGAYEAALRVSDLAGERADEARATAAGLAEEAAGARDVALSEEQAAQAEAAQIESDRTALIAELADLQDISVAMAAERQSALEQAAQERMAAAAAAEQRAAEQEAIAAAEAEAAAAPAPATAPATQPDASPAPGQEAPAPQPDRTPQPDPEPRPDPPAPAPEPQPDPPAPTPKPKPEPPPPPPPPPASTSGAQQAIGFARAQLGERYQWGGTGPSAWDCSGLLMRAWESAGKWIGRTSRQQYAEASPISAGQLRPGDLLFWTDGGPADIYHVAMYTGNGRMIHAPNSSRPVVEESMYSWPPSLYARP